jgi:XTP/dITP diphosphohydrolase
MKQLLLASRNRGKIREISALLAPLPVELLSIDDMELGEQVEETGSSYAENARLKVEALARRSGMWVLGDDTGLEVLALGGAPGLHSARYAGPGANDADRRALLVKALAGKARPWAARFCCAAALGGPGGSLDLGWGECAGEILPDAQGEAGFGYDSIFLVEGLGKTMAELTLEEKNQHSHRAQAIRALLPALAERLGVAPS